MRLFIAEKPDLAKAIASGLSGENKQLPRNCGYIQKGNDIITWAFGHILELCEPHEYDEKYKKWNIEDLPIIIDHYKYRPIADKKEQLNIIVKLINDNKVDSIVHCGDADDEGQILIDEILEYAKCKKPVYRCLINDITPEAVKKEISKMRPNSDFKGMSERGFARSIADWIVGINFTRAYTCANNQKGGSGTISVGRVQTPILGLIVARDLENDNFTTQEYYMVSIVVSINGTNVEANLKTDEKIFDKAFAQKIQSEVNSSKNAIVTLTKTLKKEYPPLPYNLLVLQAEASKLFGYSPKKTLEITQSLREKHKAISYNRSDCQYLPETIFAQSPKILDSLRKNLGAESYITNTNLQIKSKAFDDSKLSAHYGIIPTNTTLDIKNMSDDEQKIYTLIAKRFCAQFYEAREYISFELELKCGEYVFTKTLQKTTKKGFRAFFGSSEDDQDQESQINLDSLVNNSLIPLKSSEIKNLQTKPRSRYTMTTLLKDLNSVAKYVKNEKIKKLLLEKDKDKKGESGGIGTPATRSDMIEKLIAQGYIDVSKDKKQAIISKPKGKDLIKNITPMLSTPDMTAFWFEYQKAIESKEKSKEDFLKSVYNSVSSEIEQIKKNGFSLNSTIEQGIICPQCKSNNLIRYKGAKGFFWGCKGFSLGCRFVAKDKGGKPVLN